MKAKIALLFVSLAALLYAFGVVTLLIYMLHYLMQAEVYLQAAVSLGELGILL